jgi:hypothetical protein
VERAFQQTFKLQAAHSHLNRLDLTIFYDRKKNKKNVF